MASSLFRAWLDSLTETAIDPPANRELNKSYFSIFQKQACVSG